MGRVGSKLRVHAAAALSAVVFVAACGGGPASPPAAQPATTQAAISVSTTTDAPISASAELAAAQARWEAAGLATHSYAFEDDCGECEPVLARAVVWDGVWVAPSDAPQVEDMFASIDAAIVAGHSVEVTYDEALGFPKEVWIDREARAYDGGTHWLIRDFAPSLPGDAASLDALRAARTQWDAARPSAYEFRTTIICDCELAGSLFARVDGDRIVEYEIDIDSEASVTPITVDEMLDDLAELLESGFTDEGVRITGAAEFDPHLGYPSWIGLDIGVDDPDGELAYLPPRLVFVVSDFVAVDEGTDDSGRNLGEQRDAQARWTAAGLVDYSYHLTVHDIEQASFGDPYLVSVVAGEVTEVTQNGELAEPPVPVYSIDQLFTVMTLWEQQGTEIEALYDAVTGHPVLVIRYSEEPLVISIDDLVGG